MKKIDNKQYTERFEQAGIILHKMFWIAGAVESDDLKEMLLEIDIKDYEKMLPNISIESLESYLEDETPIQIFCDNDAYGFIAELRYPEHYNFSFENGEVTGCAISNGIQAIDYAYGETIEDLINNIETIAEENYQRCIAKDKKKQANKAK